MAIKYCPHSNPACSLCKLGGLTEVLTELYEELSELKISPIEDYSQRSVVKLFDEAEKARAYSERASEIAGLSITALGVARGILSDIEVDYQDKYDEVVSKNVDYYSHLSWEERASIFRAKTLTETVELRSVKKEFARVESVHQAIDILARAKYRLRGDLMAVVQIIQFGEKLGEIYDS